MQNTVSEVFSSIINGKDNAIIGKYSVILNGISNNIENDNSVILSGNNLTLNQSDTAWVGNTLRVGTTTVTPGGGLQLQSVRVIDVDTMILLNDQTVIINGAITATLLNPTITSQHYYIICLVNNGAIAFTGNLRTNITDTGNPSGVVTSPLTFPITINSVSFYSVCVIYVNGEWNLIW